MNELNKIRDYDKRLYRQTLYTDFVLKLKILQDNIEHIQDNLSAARLGIVHSNILTNEEITEYKIDFKILQNIKLGAVVDNKNNLIFIIRIPKETIKIQKTLFIPIANNQNKELVFKPTKIVKYKDEFYNYEENKNVKDLEKSSLCVFKKNCLKTISKVSEILEIEKGIIILKNQNHSNFSSTCDKKIIQLQGNYLINFSNCTLCIDNKTIQNRINEFKQSFAIPNYIEQMEEANNKLIFDDIVIKQIENIKEIKEIKYEKRLILYMEAYQ